MANHGPDNGKARTVRQKWKDDVLASLVNRGMSTSDAREVYVAEHPVVESCWEEGLSAIRTAGELMKTDAADAVAIDNHDTRRSA